MAKFMSNKITAPHKDFESIKKHFTAFNKNSLSSGRWPFSPSGENGRNSFKRVEKI